MTPPTRNGAPRTVPLDSCGSAGVLALSRRRRTLGCVPRMVSTFFFYSGRSAAPLAQRVSFSFLVTSRIMGVRSFPCAAHSSMQALV